jgi:hypothetical protein
MLPRMSRIATGWRLAKASAAVLRADGSLAVYPAVGIPAAFVAFQLAAAPGIGVAVASNVDDLAIVGLLMGWYAAVFVIVYFNVALAGATRLSMDGRDTKLRDGLAVARKRRGLIAKWALLQTTVGVLIVVIESILGEGVSRLLASLVGGIAAAAWSIATFLVIPVLALEGLGPKAALNRSVELVRQRWGEGLVGSSAIGLVVFLLGVLPFLGLCLGANELIDAGGGLAALGEVLVVVALLALVGVGSALGVVFRVELYRYSTEGHTTGGFREEDIAAAFRPGRRARL